MEPSETRLEYLAQVASLYYDRDQTQREIAKQVGVTRSAVSRLLTEAREKGIVEIVVHYPWRTSQDLEAALINQFHLKAARVLVRENKSYDEVVTGVGVLAAQYFDEIVTNFSIIGIGWGYNLLQTVRAIRPRSMPEAEVLQLIGGTGAEKGSAIGPLLAPMLANRLGCTCRYLHAPLIAESITSRDILMQERSIRATLERASHADIALLGIGCPAPELYNPYHLGYVSVEELTEVQKAGGVGDLCGQHFDIEGSIIDIDLNRRVIGLDVKALSSIKTVIGVAGDLRKADAIYGVLTRKYINVLISDDQTVQILLKRAAESQQQAF